MPRLILYRPVRDGGAARAEKVLDAIGDLEGQGQRATVEEAGGDVAIGRERVRLAYLDPRVLPGWFAVLLGSWYRVTGVRALPPHGIAGLLTLELRGAVEVSTGARR